MKFDDEIKKNNLKKYMEITRGIEKKQINLNNNMHIIARTTNNSKEKDSKLKEVANFVGINYKDKTKSNHNSNKNKNSNLLSNKSNAISVNINNLVTPKNGNILYNSINNTSNHLKYPVPMAKNNRFKQDSLMKTFGSNNNSSSKLHNISQKSNHSVINKDEKFRAISYSPNNSKEKNIYKSNTENYHNQVNWNNSNTGKVMSYSSNASLTHSPSGKNLNMLRSAEFKKLPRLNENSSSNRDRSACNSNSNSNPPSNSIFTPTEDFIYSTFYTKLMEFKILTDKQNDNFYSDLVSSVNPVNLPDNNKMKSTGTSPPPLSEYLLKIFESISSFNDNCYKYKKLIDIVTIINQREKEKQIQSKNLKIEIEKEKFELMSKDVQLKNLIQENEKNMKEKDNVENLFKVLKKKYQSVKDNFNNVTEENQYYINIVKDCKSEIEFLRDKELKMMKLMYLIKKKGIPLDEIINENSIMNDSNTGNNVSNLSDSQNQSMMTVYFPDKINIKSNLDDNKKNNSNNNKYKVDVPMLDFSSIPVYESQSSGDKGKGAGAINKKKTEENLNIIKSMNVENISDSENKKDKCKKKHNPLSDSHNKSTKKYKLDSEGNS